MERHLFTIMRVLIGGGGGGGGGGGVLPGSTTGYSFDKNTVTGSAIQVLVL